MVNIASFRKIALSFTNAEETPHFDKSSFRINKKIFATLDVKKKRAVVKLPEIEQSVFCANQKLGFYPVTGAWGKQGWTFIELNNVPQKMLKDALSISYTNVVSKKKK